MTDLKVTIGELTRFNWENALELELHDYQQDYLPEILYSIAQSKFENLTPMGIFLDAKMVGFAMYGIFGGISWISRLLVDKAHQEKGIGKEALQLLIERLRRDPQAEEIRTSFARQNALAEYFFTSNGFRRLSEGLDEEIVMRYRGK
ncbi:MAG: GNAT family N-acetyltransferase [Bacteroidota bacterium]